MATTNFAGDLLIKGGLEGGEIEVDDGLISDCETFSTSIYLSLFGGNANDDSGRSKDTWWGNLIPGTKQEEKYISKFQAVINGVPLSARNLQKAQTAAKEDLSWIVDKKIADEVNATLSAENKNRVYLYVTINKDGTKIYECEYAFQWKGALDGLQ